MSEVIVVFAFITVCSNERHAFGLKYASVNLIAELFATGRGGTEINFQVGRRQKETNREQWAICVRGRRRLGVS